MKLLEFLRKSLITYLILVACITIATGILGIIYEPQSMFGYEAFFSPVILGAVSMLPILITFSRRELSFKQMLRRKVLQLLVLEGLLLAFGYYTALLNKNTILPFAISVLVVYIVSDIVLWLVDYKKAEQLTKSLKAFQEEVSHTEN